jgi:hypothetical protein
VQVSKNTNWRDLPYDTMRRREVLAVVEELTEQPENGRLSDLVGRAFIDEVLLDEELMTNLNGDFVPRPPAADGTACSFFTCFCSHVAKANAREFL